MDTNQEEIEHLHEMADAYKARLRILELQLAQLGIHSPAYIHLEIRGAKQGLYFIEKQISDKSKIHQNISDSPRPLAFCVADIICFMVAGVLVTSILISTIFFNEAENFENPLQRIEEAYGTDITKEPSSKTVNCTPTAIHELGVVVWKDSELDKATSLPIGTRVSFICYSPQIGRVGVILIRLPVEVNHERRVLWVIETYRCLDEQRVSSYPDPERPNR